MIMIDQRELTNQNGRLIYQKLDEPFIVWLEHGDYLIRGNRITVLVERVSNTGLLSDIETGRMVEKLKGCAEDADVVILFIEGLIFPGRDGHALVQEGGYSFNYFNLKGPFTEGVSLKMSLRRTGFHYHSIAEFLTSVCLRWVHKIEYTLSPIETAYRLKELDNYFSKDKHSLHLQRTRPFDMKGENDLHELLLAEFPGIGRERAKAIVRYFGKAPLGWTVSKEELCKVEGIGRTTAQRLISLLEGG